jgi:hypothetical protein
LNTKKLLSKIALDSSGNKLGKIIDIDNIETKESKEKIRHAIILVKRILSKNHRVALPVRKILKREEEKIWFNITKNTLELIIQNSEYSHSSQEECPYILCDLSHMQSSGANRSKRKE